METCPEGSDWPHGSPAAAAITLIGQLGSHVCCIGGKGSWGSRCAQRLREKVLSGKEGPHALEQEPHNHSHILREGNK